MRIDDYLTKNVHYTPYLVYYTKSYIIRDICALILNAMDLWGL